ncbi:MAG: peptidoglycan DD-metalloendopeptidase family protein [Chloroflexota bacterium]|nr:MAG: peptidoglycan DD-metalloendopeptidase family protein [Chloroflexota bacterium]
MQDNQLPEELQDSSAELFPTEKAEGITAPEVEKETKATGESRYFMLFDSISRLGIADSVLRIGTHMLFLALALLVVWAMRAYYLRSQEPLTSQNPAQAAALPTSTPTYELPDLPPLLTDQAVYKAGIPRLAQVHTTIPTRPRTEVTTYVVQPGDTVFGIAEMFGLKPETILWGNYFTLADNPHALVEGQELNILPMDGTYHKWSAGEGLNGVAQGYSVTPEDIINWPGNNLNPETMGDWSNPNIEPGTFLVVPGGSRQYVTWSAPRITRQNPGVAKFIGPGACGTIIDGAVGTGAFIWPSSAQFLSGYDYSPATNHFGIDIDGDLGEPMWASDSGVVVYAGWNNFGYGNMVVIDHGNGWQTAYAHMQVITVGCGQSVFQGTPIGTIGSTGKSSGPHIHYEMLHDSYGKVNPWDFLP